MEITVLNLDDIHPYTNNPRKNDGAVDAVAESIRQCGYIAPIIVDEQHEILAGHTRYKALRKLGRKEAPVLVQTGLTEEQKRKYRLLDNKTGELASWDLALLPEELEGLDFEGLDLDWGINFKPESEVLEDEFEGEPPKAPRSQKGDIYQLGRLRGIKQSS